MSVQVCHFLDLLSFLTNFSWVSTSMGWSLDFRKYWPIPSVCLLSTNQNVRWWHMSATQLQPLLPFSWPLCGIRHKVKLPQTTTCSWFCSSPSGLLSQLSTQFWWYTSMSSIQHKWEFLDWPASPLLVEFPWLSYLSWQTYASKMAFP